MKKLSFIAAALLAIATGCTTYELNTEFAMPQALVSPSTVTLDVTSSSTVVLSWNGGGAEDGGIVLYNVLFDKKGGNFSEPIAVMPSDLGARNTLTLTHAQINTLARKAGVKPNESGSFIWTVTGAKGGVTKKYEGAVGELNVIRGEGIDNIPEHLYINGSAALEAGQEFRVAEEGVYVIFTEVGAGSLKLTSEKDGGFVFYADENKKLSEGDGAYNIETAPETGLARITVNFNTLSFSIDEVAKNVRAVWGATYFEFATLEYQGNGVFSGEGDVDFYGPGTNMEDNPDWCSWVEERYYFIATVNGNEICWGSTFGSGAWTPDGTEAFWFIVENPWEQWNNLWKMDHAFDDCHVTMVIETNKNNTWTHSYTGGAITYDQPTAAPAQLIMGGAGSEGDGQEMVKVGDKKFTLINKLKDGEITLIDAEGKKYFADAEGKLFVGNRKTKVAASEGVTKVIVDFESKTISYEEIAAEVFLKFAANYADVVTLTYQGMGKYAGEDDVLFLGPGRDGTPDWCSWAEERYYFIVKVNGTDMCWGRLDDVSGENRPDDPSALPGNYWNFGEFSWDQWSHCWKMASEWDESTVTVILNANEMTHSVTVKSQDPVKPSITPETLTLSGAAAEVEGQAFEKVADGVFSAICKLNDGKLCFKSGKKTYFLDAEQGLLEGTGDFDVTAPKGLANKITVDFNSCTVKVQEVTHLKAIWGCNNCEFITFKYDGNGMFSGEGSIKFIQPGDPIYGLATWLTWVEERYRYIITIDETEDYCWGRLDAADGENRPDNPDKVEANFWQFGEFEVGGQWDHLWKLASNLDGADASFVLNAWDKTQTITKK